MKIFATILVFLLEVQLTSALDALFSAQQTGQSNGWGVGGSNRGVSFNVIKVNKENVFTNNKFTSPIKGLYEFYFSGAAETDGATIILSSYGSPVSSLAKAEAGITNQQASNSIIVELPWGTQVGLTLVGGSNLKACDPACTTFHGRLIRTT